MRPFVVALLCVYCVGGMRVDYRTSNNLLYKDDVSDIPDQSRPACFGLARRSRTQTVNIPFLYNTYTGQTSPMPDNLSQVHPSIIAKMDRDGWEVRTRRMSFSQPFYFRVRVCCPWDRRCQRKTLPVDRQVMSGNPCQNGGRLVIQGGVRQCLCGRGFRGQLCQYPDLISRVQGQSYRGRPIVTPTPKVVNDLTGKANLWKQKMVTSRTSPQSPGTPPRLTQKQHMILNSMSGPWASRAAVWQQKAIRDKISEACKRRKLLIQRNRRLQAEIMMAMQMRGGNPYSVISKADDDTVSKNVPTSFRVRIQRQMTSQRGPAYASTPRKPVVPVAQGSGNPYSQVRPYVEPPKFGHPVDRAILSPKARTPWDIDPFSQAPAMMIDPRTMVHPLQYLQNMLRPEARTPWDIDPFQKHPLMGDPRAQAIFEKERQMLTLAYYRLMQAQQTINEVTTRGNNYPSPLPSPPVNGIDLSAQLPPQSQPVSTESPIVSIDIQETQIQTVPEETPLGDEKPLGEEEIPVEEEKPLGEELPLEDDQPLGAEQPLGEEQPLDEEKPLGDENPLGAEQSLENEQPLGEEQPLAEEQPLGVEQPLGKEEPLGEEITLGVENPLGEEKTIEEEMPLGPSEDTTPASTGDMPLGPADNQQIPEAGRGQAPTPEEIEKMESCRRYLEPELDKCLADFRLDFAQFMNPDYMALAQDVCVSSSVVGHCITTKEHVCGSEHLLARKMIQSVMQMMGMVCQQIMSRGDTPMPPPPQPAVPTNEIPPFKQSSESEPLLESTNQPVTARQPIKSTNQPQATAESTNKMPETEPSTEDTEIPPLAPTEKPNQRKFVPTKSDLKSDATVPPTSHPEGLALANHDTSHDAIHPVVQQEMLLLGYPAWLVIALGGLLLLVAFLAVSVCCLCLRRRKQKSVELEVVPEPMDEKKLAIIGVPPPLYYTTAVNQTNEVDDLSLPPLDLVDDCESDDTEKTVEEDADDESDEKTSEDEKKEKKKIKKDQD